jgi:hypothetical protein
MVSARNTQIVVAATPLFHLITDWLFEDKMRAVFFTQKTSHSVLQIVAEFFIRQSQTVSLVVFFIQKTFEIVLWIVAEFFIRQSQTVSLVVFSIQKTTNIVLQIVAELFVRRSQNTDRALMYVLHRHVALINPINTEKGGSDSKNLLATVRPETSKNTTFGENVSPQVAISIAIMSSVLFFVSIYKNGTFTRKLAENRTAQRVIGGAVVASLVAIVVLIIALVGNWTTIVANGPLVWEMANTIVITFLVVAVLNDGSDLKATILAAAKSFPLNAAAAAVAQIATISVHNPAEHAVLFSMVATVISTGANLATTAAATPAEGTKKLGMAAQKLSLAQLVVALSAICATLWIALLILALATGTTTIVAGGILIWQIASNATYPLLLAAVLLRPGWRGLWSLLFVREQRYLWLGIATAAAPAAYVLGIFSGLIGQGANLLGGIAYADTAEARTLASLMGIGFAVDFGLLAMNRSAYRKGRKGSGK